MKSFLSTLKDFIVNTGKKWTHNAGWKALSLLIAVLLWSYVISSNPSITRDISLSGVDVVISGQSVLQGRQLALVTDPTSALKDVRVRVAVPQSDYARVKPDSVSVELDLTRIRQTGTQILTLSGRSTYGEVVQVTPATIELEVEPLDQRTVPVNVYPDAGEDDSHWYNVVMKNPASISVSGPSSVVRQVSSALVDMDVSGLNASVTQAEQFILLDASGEEITFPLTCSTSTVTVGIEAYPAKRLAILDGPDVCTTGALPEGYRISNLELSPSGITVAGDQALLDGMTSIAISPVDVTGATQSFSTVTDVVGVKDLKYISSAQITMTVYIEEIEASQRFGGVKVSVRGDAAALVKDTSVKTVEVKVTGAYNSVMALKSEDIIAYADVSGLETGKHEVEIHVEVDNLPDLSFEVYPEKIDVSIE